MSAASTMPMGSARRPVPAQARALAARLAALFEADSRIVVRLNDAHRRLADANDRLWSGLAPDAFGLIYDGTAPAGHSQIAALIDAASGAGGSGPETVVLQALQDAHWQVHHAFGAYQSACEQRRQLAFDVGELARKLTEALCAAGWAEEDTQRVDVHHPARLGERVSDRREPAR
jgi:hypothetical protein